MGFHLIFFFIFFFIRSEKCNYRLHVFMSFILTIFGTMNSSFNFTNQLILIRYFLILGCLFFQTGILKAQELPPIQNYGIVDYGAGSQNWSITQSIDKHIFFGNNIGLLEFDGARWKLYPSPNGTIIRAVHRVDDLIYTGCYMEFGYWSSNEYGKFEYVSLLDKLSEPLIDDEHFWNITSRDEWVLFQSLNRIYLYNIREEKFEIIDFNTTRAKIFNLGSNIYIQKKSGGLYAIQNGKAVLMSDHKIFSVSFIVGIYKVTNKLLIITEDGKFYFFDNNTITEWKIDGLVGIQELNLYTSLQLNDGGFILGTISKGYIHLDKTGQIVETINQERGLINNTVLTAFQDADDNLWIGLDNGISTVNLASAFKVYTDIKGKLGDVYASIVYNGNVYLGTNQGLFFKNLNSLDEFKMLKNTNGQVWDLKLIDDTLFCSHNRGTFIINGEVAEQIFFGSGTWGVNLVKGREGLILQGNYNGLSILKKEGGQWKFRNKIDGFDISSKTVVLLADQKVLINHEFKGVFKLKIDQDFKTIVNTELIPSKGYDSSISSYRDMILYASNEGIFDFDPGTMQFSMDSLLTDVFYNEEDKVRGRLIVERDTDKIWGFSQGNIISMTPDNFDATPLVTKVAIPEFFRRNLGVTGYENMSQVIDNHYLIGTSNGYATLNLDLVKEEKYEVSLNSIYFEHRNFDIDPVSLKNGQEFEYDHGDLNVSFNVPEYDKYAKVSYQYQLKGLNDDWSKWFHDSSISLGRLPYGSYTFVVKAKVGNKILDNLASFDFKIKKPWYLTNLAIALYLIGFFVFMGAIYQSYLSYYRRQRNKLIQENTRNLEMNQLQNKQEIILLRNEQLKSELDNKNRELAITAMSLINKNELLLGIKRDLLLLQSESSKDDVIKIIDKNLKNNNDWDFFKEAFNNADKDFLKKIKSLHPNLTANDLKFCAFLRLNLSSKEIAPLLNISVRSVEIKRYRLRKKLNLEHSDSLIDYILEV